MSGPQKPIEPDTERSHAGVICAKCEHSNARGRNTCEKCGAHLHVVCHHCGHHNARVAHRCEECGHNLHRSLGRRWARAFAKKNGKMSLAQLILLILAIMAGMGLIISLSDFQFHWPF